MRISRKEDLSESPLLPAREGAKEANRHRINYGNYQRFDLNLYDSIVLYVEEETDVAGRMSSTEFLAVFA